MEKETQINIVGSGVMGEAIIDGLLSKNRAVPEQIFAADALQARCDELAKHYSIQTSTDNTLNVDRASVVILAVKPQQLVRVSKSLKGKIPVDALVLSIVAGTSIENLSKSLEHAHIVRAMPNTPCRISEGITVWTASPSVSEGQLGLARNILSAMGSEIFLDDENYLDMATALSGTGPAYVFLFMEAMIDAGVHLGFPRRIAEQLVVQTVRGSVDYYEWRKTHAAALRNEVTSPGGTSAAAIYYLEKAGFRTAISRAVWAAYERSQELGRGRDSQAPEK